MAITVDPDDVRGALETTTEETPESEIQFEIKLAEQLVNDDLAPYSTNTDRLELVGAIIAAAYHANEGPVQRAKEGDGSVAFDTSQAITLWDMAVQMDPTGQLAEAEKREATISVPDARGID